jgi:mycothione reductase
MTGRPVSVVIRDYGGAAYGWALEDTTSFVKLIGDPHTRKLLGAHAIGYQASLLIQLFVQGMHLGQTVDELVHGQIWIHPALSEVAEQAMLELVDEMDRAGG